MSSVLTEQSHGHDVAGTWSLQGKNAYAGISVHALKAGSITSVYRAVLKTVVSNCCKLAPNEEVF